MVSIKDVAKHAGVAISTVSKVLNNYPNVSEATKKKVQEAVAELNFVPNSVAAALSSKQSGRVALLMNLDNVSQAVDEINMQYMAGTIGQAVEMNLDVITVFYSMLKNKSLEEVTRYLQSQSITGLIIFGMSKDDKVLHKLIDTMTFKIVAVDAPLVNENTSSVWIDQARAQSVLQPLIDDGTLVVVSGQTDFTQCATVDWDNSKAQSRMDAILAGNYSDIEIDGVLSPNDGIARAIITSCENAGQPIPVVSGLDAENESVEWVWSGRQYSTVAKPTNALVGETVSIIDSLLSGNGMPATDVTANNGVIDVPIYELPPVVVTKENAKEVFADDPDRMALLTD